MRYLTVGRYIYYNTASGSYPANEIYRYDTLSGTSTVVILNAYVDLKYGMWQATEDYVFFLNATVKHKGSTYYGSLIYDISKDKFTSITSGQTSSDKNPFGISVAVFANRSLYVGGQFYYLNGIRKDKIARYDLVVHKIYSLDGGLYRSDAGCHPFSVDGFASIGDKLLVYGDFQSAGIR
jgi:hypothetical protein